jgi:hypothetical protein
MPKKAKSKVVRKPTRPSRPKVALEDLAQPSWVVEMHRHYGTHGYFRASDLDRVLGNPAGYTEGQALPVTIGNLKKEP